MRPRLVETRDLLAPYLGQWIRCRGTLMRDANQGRRQTFVARVDSHLDGCWVRVASHTWVIGDRLCRIWGAGVDLEFDAMVRHYRSVDPTSGRGVDRYGLAEPCNPLPLGPTDLNEFVRELVDTWGWERVANAVEATHGGR